MVPAALDPWPAERIVHDAAGICVVDKPPGWVVHGDDPQVHADVVSRLADLFRARGEDPYLAVHQRLDKGASGALAFVRRQELNQSVARDFEEHRARRKYVALVAGSLGGSGRMEDRIETGADGKSRIVARGGRRAAARYRVIRTGPGLAWVELETETGRTHQLRVQLAHRGAPIVGDSEYGGPTAPRLFLHAVSIELPSVPLCVQVPVPHEFEEWFGGGRVAWPTTAELTRRLSTAASGRYRLVRDSDAVRLVDDEADLLPGVVIDAYGDFAVITTCTAAASEQEAEVAAALLGLGARGVYLKRRARGDIRGQSLDALAPSGPVAGEAAPAPLVVREGTLRFETHLDDGLATGLFTDQRESRQRVLDAARGARVLNLFSYTCSFSVAAAKAGARETVSVDLSRRALEQGRRNFLLNGLSCDGHRFLKEDVLEYLARAVRRGERFQWVVLDPPSFASRRRGVFSVAKHYPLLATQALTLLVDGGVLLAVTNHRKTTHRQFRRMIEAAAAKVGRRIRRIQPLRCPPDHPHRPGGEAPVKTLFVTLEAGP